MFYFQISAQLMKKDCTFADFTSKHATNSNLLSKKTESQTRVREVTYFCYCVASAKRNNVAPYIFLKMDYTVKICEEDFLCMRMIYESHLDRSDY